MKTLLNTLTMSFFLLVVIAGICLFSSCDENPFQPKVKISLSEDHLDFGDSYTTCLLDIKNHNDTRVSWSIQSNRYWLTVDPSSGTTEGDSKTYGVRIEVDRTGLSLGEHKGTLTFSCKNSSNDIELPVTVTVRKLAPSTPNGLQVSKYYDDQIMINWDAVDDINGYRLYRSEGCDGDYSLLRSLSSRYVYDTNVAQAQ